MKSIRASICLAVLAAAALAQEPEKQRFSVTFTTWQNGAEAREGGHTLPTGTLVLVRTDDPAVEGYRVTISYRQNGTRGPLLHQVQFVERVGPRGHSIFPTNVVFEGYAASHVSVTALISGSTEEAGSDR